MERTIEQMNNLIAALINGGLADVEYVVVSTLSLGVDHHHLCVYAEEYGRLYVCQRLGMHVVSPNQID